MTGRFVLNGMTLGVMSMLVIGQVESEAQARGGGGARNVIFFVGDGMGVSTVTATRAYSVGVDGALAIDQFPYTALSKVYTADHLTPDSAGTMSAMMSGVNCNSGVIGFPATTERRDFNRDGDGEGVWTLLEIAEQNGLDTGVVSTARITHATPAACYAKVNERNLENDIALQALPTESFYNDRLGNGIEVMMGGGRRHFVPVDMVDEEGGTGARGDLRDLRQEYQDAGYTYVWDAAGFDALDASDVPVLGLFERSHMEYEYDRPGDTGGEPSLAEMTLKAIELLETSENGYFLMVESGRIDHAHHAGNARRSLDDTEEFDKAIEAAAAAVGEDTLIIVTADHSHVFTMAGYPMLPAELLQYSFNATSIESASYATRPAESVVFDLVYDIDPGSGEVFLARDSNKVPYTVLGYHNGPGYRGTRTDPRTDTFPGLDGNAPSGPTDPEYLQEAAVPLSSETHSAEEVAIYAIGPDAERFAGTVKNTFIFDVMLEALGLPRP